MSVGWGDRRGGSPLPRRSCDADRFPAHRLASGLRCSLRALQQRATQKATKGASHQKREARAEPNSNRDDRYGPLRQIVHGAMSPSH
jgi:hypothetical protein